MLSANCSFVYCSSVRGESDKFLQSLLNIVKNGIESMRDGRLLSIEVKFSGDLYQLYQPDFENGLKYTRVERLGQYESNKNNILKVNEIKDNMISNKSSDFANWGIKVRKIKVGIVGLGRLGMVHASHLALDIHNAELVAACSVVPEELVQIQRSLGVSRLYSKYEDLVGDDQVEAVVLVTPSGQHPEQIRLALDAGRHVFSEKPLGTTAADCDIAVQVARNHPDLVAMIGFMRRYDPSYAYAKKLIDEGAIGTPFMVRLTSIDPERLIDGAIQYAGTSGGFFLDMMIHDIDLARWLLQDEPQSVWAIGGCHVHEEFAQYGDVDNTCAMMKFSRGGMAMFFAGRDAAHGYHVETEITGTKGMLRIGSVPQKNLVMLFNEHGAVQECVSGFPERFHDAYRLELQAFIDAIANSTNPGVSVEDGKRATEIALSVTESYRTGKLLEMASS